MQTEQDALEGKNSSSKKQILKATGIMGGAKVISILIRIVRVKIVAVLLGPAGVGVIGLYQSTLEIVQTATSLGLGFSAVRDIAEAAGTNNQHRIGRSITILRRWVWLTGLLGMTLLFLFREQFSQYAFNDTGHTFYFLLLAVVPLFAAISGGQMALLQGLRRIGDMARASVVGGALGLCITVPLYWQMGIKGIVPALILAAIADLGLSYYFSRRVTVPKVNIGWRETITGGSRMIRLGLFTVIAGLVAMGSMYLVRIFISGKIGLEGVGQFQAAWNLSNTYVGLILGAMGADYFPRLSAVNQDNVQVCKLVNEQTEISLLLAGPLIVGMICSMNLVVWLFYSAQFEQSINILLWQSLGNLLKLISWPMGFVLLAKGKGNYFVFNQLLWNALFLTTIWLLWDYSALESTGVAFLVGYVVLIGVNYGFCKMLCGFSWSRQNVKSILILISLSIMAFINTKYHSLPYWQIYDAVFLIVSIFYSYYELNKIIDIEKLIHKILKKMGFNKVQ